MQNTLKLKQLGLDTYKEAVVILHQECPIRKSEGFEVPKRVKVTLGDKTILATLITIKSDALTIEEASLSKFAWDVLNANDGDLISLSHGKPLQSFSHVRSKIYGHELNLLKFSRIIEDVINGNYTDVHIATFLAACAGGRLNENEIIDLTKCMINSGKKITWASDIIVDKHCVGGLPGNRTTLIVVPIVAEFGLLMPKTSSRAITSPAGTADTMEVLAPVDLDLPNMRRVVEKENGCIVWGGSVSLSPSDDILIRVERVIDLDSEGQMVASILSKKIAAGATHILIDMPIGPTAKVRSNESAQILNHYLSLVAATFGVQISTIFSNGLQPVGRGIGPTLEALDVLSVLQGQSTAPQDLRDRALTIAGKILEFSKHVQNGNGKNIATEILESGRAWKKFQAICDAQGGMREPKLAAHKYICTAKHSGYVTSIHNRELAKLATLAGAPNDKSAGIVLHTPLGTIINKGQPLFTIYSESKGELDYALSVLRERPRIIKIEDQI